MYHWDGAWYMLFYIYILFENALPSGGGEGDPALTNTKPTMPVFEGRSWGRGNGPATPKLTVPNKQWPKVRSRSICYEWEGRTRIHDVATDNTANAICWKTV